ncbi:MAG: phage holin family protein [Microlunatus sp.]|nr:phage holin family protein [Microlunatus sp.]MDN5803163.1 phage holin family protein [Microlunatus sp.]
MIDQTTGETGASQPSGRDGDPGSGTSELLSALGQDLRAVLQEELDRLRGELGDSLRDGRRAALLFGGAAVLGALATGTSAALVLRALSSFLPRPLAALVATGMYGVGAAVLARQAVAEVRRAQQSLPSR